jgi:hypothetical protein
MKRLALQNSSERNEDGRKGVEARPRERRREGGKENRVGR